MEKEFVPYQESLELKELGFDEPCFGFYGGLNPLGDRYYHTSFGYNRNSDIGSSKNFHCTRVLYQQAFRWFRKNHNLEYQIIKSANGNYSVVIHLNTQEYLNKISTLQHACLYEIVDCYSYEEAELACLRKLIEIVKQK